MDTSEAPGGRVALGARPASRARGGTRAAGLTGGSSRVVVVVGCCGEGKAALVACIARHNRRLGRSVSRSARQGVRSATDAVWDRGCVAQCTCAAVWTAVGPAPGRPARSARSASGRGRPAPIDPSPGPPRSTPAAPGRPARPAARGPPLPRRAATTTLAHVKWMCESCGFIYDPEEGDADGGIPPGTSFDDIPETWFCPVCGARKRDFSPYED
jgi:rubredoxin